MKKKLLSLVLIAMLAMSVVACGAAEGDQVLTPATTEAPAESEATVNTDATAEAPVETEAPAEDEAPAQVAGTLTFDIPEGFTDDGTGYYEHSDEMTFATIYTYTVENDGSFNMISKELLLLGLQAGLTSELGEEVDIEMTAFEKVTIGEYDAVEYSIAYEFQGIAFEQTQFIINEPDVFRYVTYTNINGDGYAEIFAASGDSLRYE